MPQTPNDQELIVTRQTISIPYRFSTGPLFGRFLAELRDNQRILAPKCSANGRFLLPPREVDAWSMTEPDAWVEVGPEGTIQLADIVYFASPDPLTGETREVPYAVGWIHLDGTEDHTTLWHLVEAKHPEKVRSGMRVRAVFAEARTGSVHDIKYFELLEEE